MKNPLVVPVKIGTHVWKNEYMRWHVYNHDNKMHCFAHAFKDDDDGDDDHASE